MFSAKDAGITVMNEIGLDPGIDHLYAVKTIEEVHREGGKVKKNRMKEILLFSHGMFHSSKSSFLSVVVFLLLKTLTTPLAISSLGLLVVFFWL